MAKNTVVIPPARKAPSAVAAVLSVPTQAETAPVPVPETRSTLRQEADALIAATADDGPLANVRVKPSKDDLMQVTVFQEIMPPPIIGNWRGADELGVTKLEPKKTYRVPRFVAEVLVDANKAAVLE